MVGPQGDRVAFICFGWNKFSSVEHTVCLLLLEYTMTLPTSGVCVVRTRVRTGTPTTLAMYKKRALFASLKWIYKVGGRFVCSGYLPGQQPLELFHAIFSSPVSYIIEAPSVLFLQLLSVRDYCQCSNVSTFGDSLNF